MSELSLPYRLPITGISLIEASAGTGKTHTLIRLIARHVLWHNRQIDQVLAVTFTKAATSELRSRLRTFLQALDVYIVAQNSDDEDFDQLLFGGPAELELSTLILRLKQALATIDKVAIYTIHGFCQRMLNEYPLLTGQSIPSPEFSDDTQDLYLQICQEFWRLKGQESHFSDALANTWPNPDAMLKICSELLSNAKLVPARPTLLTAPDIDAAHAHLSRAFHTHHQQAEQLLIQAIESKCLNGVTHSIKKTQRQLLALQKFLAAPIHYADLELGQLAASQFKLNNNKIAPVNPLFAALDEWLDFADSLLAYHDSLSIYLLHDFRDYLRNRLAVLKQQRNQISSDDFIEQLLRALQAPQGSTLASDIRAAYPVTFVDEFQDTDDRQWAIFKILYNNQQNTSLTLIGDPKQAIYAFRGGDIHTYLEARKTAQQQETLHGNHRTNADLLHAVQRLFTDITPHPFYEQDIEFIAVSAEKAPGKVCVSGNPLPPIQFLCIPAKEDGKTQSTGRASLQCAQQCANQIAWLCQEISTGNAHVESEHGKRALTHHDIVVLVDTNKQAALLQRHLNDLSVLSVCVDKTNVFDSYEAIDIQNILSYLLAPSGLQQQQNAQYGVLLQCAQVADFNIALKLEQLRKQGALGCFSPLLQCAESAILALPNGERRLSNYWQVIELIQSQCPHSDELPELLDWYGRQLAKSSRLSNEDDDNKPRLESSVQRIRIMTLHKSKGLEFGIVFMPFSVINKNKPSVLQRYFDGAQRCLYYSKNPPDVALAGKIQAERDSENLRLLYVGATRAVFALYLSWGHVKNNTQCALNRVLHGGNNVLTALDINAQLQRFAVAPWRALEVPSFHTAHTPLLPATLNASRKFSDFWKVSSFSSLHQSKEIPYSSPASDETTRVSDLDFSPYKGAAFGNAMHYVLEHVRPQDWQAPSIDALNSAAKQLAFSALLQFGYDSKSAESGVLPLCTLVHNTLHGLLPEDISLLQLAAPDTRHEMEFHLQLSHADSVEILSILQQYGYCLARKQLGFLSELHGLLTGRIDLLFCHQQRYFIVDYKSNALPGYSPSHLAESISTQEYDLQYVLYSVALHRFMLHKFADDYDYDKHVGGVRYLYARGMQAGTSEGIYCDRPCFSMIKQLDLCFDASRGGRYVA